MQLGRVIDADGHILEPPNLWKENLEAKFKDRALGIARDKEGWESLLVDGRISSVIRGLGVASAFGSLAKSPFLKSLATWMDRKELMIRRPA